MCVAELECILELRIWQNCWAKKMWILKRRFFLLRRNYCMLYTILVHLFKCDMIVMMIATLIFLLQWWSRERSVKFKWFMIRWWQSCIFLPIIFPISAVATITKKKMLQSNCLQAGIANGSMTWKETHLKSIFQIL